MRARGAVKALLSFFLAVCTSRAVRANRRPLAAVLASRANEAVLVLPPCGRRVAARIAARTVGIVVVGKRAFGAVHAHSRADGTVPAESALRAIYVTSKADLFLVLSSVAIYARPRFRLGVLPFRAIGAPTRPFDAKGSRRANVAVGVIRTFNRRVAASRAVGADGRTCRRCRSCVALGAVWRPRGAVGARRAHSARRGPASSSPSSSTISASRACPLFRVCADMAHVAYRLASSSLKFPLRAIVAKFCAHDRSFGARWTTVAIAHARKVRVATSPALVTHAPPVLFRVPPSVAIKTLRTREPAPSEKRDVVVR